MNLLTQKRGYLSVHSALMTEETLVLSGMTTSLCTLLDSSENLPTITVGRTILFSSILESEICQQSEVMFRKF